MATYFFFVVFIKKLNRSDNFYLNFSSPHRGGIRKKAEKSVIEGVVSVVIQRPRHVNHTISAVIWTCNDKLMAIRFFFFFFLHHTFWRRISSQLSTCDKWKWRKKGIQKPRMKNNRFVIWKAVLSVRIERLRRADLKCQTW